MKKFSLIVMALALVMGLSQCQKRPNMPVLGGERQTITFTTGNGGGAKGNFEQLNKVLNYKWTEGDKIYVYASTDGTFEEDHSQFCGILDFVSCTQEADGSYKGVFSSTITMPYSNGKVMFVHYGQNVTVDSGTGAASVSFAEQNGNLTGDNSVSSKVIASCVTDYSLDGNYNNESLTVEFAVVKLSFEKFTAKDEITFTNIGCTDIIVDKCGKITQSGENTAKLENVNDSYYTVFVKPVNAETTYKFDSSNETSHITTSNVEKGIFYTDNASGESIVLAVDHAYDDIVNGAFSVSADKKVYFAKGNLQYQASTNTWRIAEHQYDCVGDNSLGTVYENGEKCSNAKISATYTGWIDYFGFGSNGQPHSDSVAGKVPCYRPYCVNGTDNYYKVYNTLTKHLYDEDQTADWGYNIPGNWYTLTKDNWNYLISRSGDKACDFEYGGKKYTDVRYVKAGVKYDGTKCIYGTLFFPDLFKWTAEMGNVPNNINNPNTEWEYTTKFTPEQFKALEDAGCLFMPAAGYRYISGGGPSTNVYAVNRIGDYWTSTRASNAEAYIFQCLNGSDDANRANGVHTKTHERCHGFTVRLATDVIESNTDGTAVDLQQKPW
ncbi:MAG: hypothetical protein Q4F69_06935 [Bacteroidia bacterium]|nr:hypothetical protein [Bacteroidia bacterium]